MYVTNQLKNSQLGTLVTMFCTQVPKASLLFQRVLLSQSLGRMPRILKPGALSISGFCDDGVESLAVMTLMERGGKQVLEITPKQYVNLSQDWTLFIGSSTPAIQEGNPSIKLTDQSEMFLLIEATPPYTDEYGRVYLRKVPAERAVKLSRLTKPIAWKSGEPFGIVVKASVEQCARTGMAFLDGVLELDDGLLVEHIATVGISGKAHCLLSRKASLHATSKPKDASKNRLLSSPNVQNHHQLHHTESKQDVDSHQRTSDSTLLRKDVDSHQRTSDSTVLRKDVDSHQRTSDSTVLRNDVDSHQRTSDSTVLRKDVDSHQRTSDSTVLRKDVDSHQRTSDSTVLRKDVDSHQRTSDSTVLRKDVDSHQRTSDSTVLRKDVDSHQRTSDSTVLRKDVDSLQRTSDSTVLRKQHIDEEPNCNDSRPDAHSHRIPNVLVYTGSNDQEPDHYLMVKQILQQHLHPDHYVIYHLTKTQILNHPWIDNTALIVLSSELEPHESVEATEKVKSFLAAGGKVLSFSSRLYFPDSINLTKQTWHKSIIDVEYYNALSESTTHLRSLHRDYSFKVNQDAGKNDRKLTIIARCNSQPVILEVRSEGDGMAILCEVRLDLDPTKDKKINSDEFAELKKSNEARHKVLLDMFSRLDIVCALGAAPSLSPCYLLAKSDRVRRSFLDTIEGHLRGGVLKSRLTDLQFVDDFPSDQELDPECIPVITTEDSKAMTFDMEAYRNHLHSKVLGNVVLYSEVVPTTMSLFEGFMFHVDDNVGTVAIATRMTQGRGRGGNKWISPKGCAMFSSHVRIPIHSHLGQRLPYLQHIASTAVVEAVRSLNGYENIDLRLKWPNDIYYGNKIKLGGVIINSCCWEKQFHAIIGCGFNVSNSDPTICINDLVSRYNQEHGTNLLPLTRELLIARTLTYMERIIEDFQVYGKDSFLPGYYKRWLHSGMKVHLEKEDGPEVDVVSLDDMGFLAVMNQSGQVSSVQPDGNSFDMMKNLLVTKARP